MALAFKPYVYQERCLKKLRQARRQRARRALIVMATGLGKTVTAAFFVRREFRGDGRKVLFLCHNNDILEQSRETFEKVVGGPTEQYGYFNGREKNRHEVKYLFASFQTMKDWREEFDKDEFALIIVDEGHHGPAKTYRPTIEHFTPEFLLGMTATPDRTDLQDIRAIYGQEVFDLPLEDALAAGYLTPVRYELLTDEIVARRLRGRRDVQTDRGRMKIKDLNKLFAIPRRDKAVVRRIRRYTRDIPNPRVMIFCPSIAYCNWLHEQMPGSVAIHSGTKAKERREGLAAFRTGASTTILGIDVFNEGIDVPEANVIVFLRSTSTDTVFFQQLGRGLRKADGKSEVLVLDLVGNCKRLEMVFGLREAVAKRRAGTHRLEEVDASFRFNFSAEAVQLMELLRTARSFRAPEEMLAGLRALYQELGHTPTTTEIDRAYAAGKSASMSVLQKQFGSYTKALRAAGLKPNRGPWPREELIADLKALSERLGKTPTTTEVTAAHRAGTCAPLVAFTTEFGAFPEAVKAAGLKPIRQTSVTRGELIADLKALAERLGKTPTTTEVIAAHKAGRCHSLDQFDRVFGDFGEALRAAGFRPNRNPSREELIGLLKRLAQKLGRTPTVEDVNERAGTAECVHSSTFAKVFGSFNEALKAAGLTPNREARSRDDLIAILQRLGRECGGVPTVQHVTEDSKKGGGASIRLFYAEFGSFTEALRAAGFTPVKQRTKTKRA